MLSEEHDLCVRDDIQVAREEPESGKPRFLITISFPLLPFQLFYHVVKSKAYLTITWNRVHAPQIATQYVATNHMWIFKFRIILIK